ncbi:MAG: D-alanyl-D-alanine carboxypeptidase [Rhodospirillaceae bacterium]|nr:D-alanyl-D-alanine carboxypeptidase [Rhodospirillaceae bacterium]
MVRTILLTFLVFACLVMAPLLAEARYASLVVDADTGMELHARNADTRNFPASLTKIMTLYMVFEALKQRKWTLATRLKVSHRAARQPQTRLGLKTGTTITVRDAILALITRSANDVATVVGENMAGTEFRFAVRMTDRARRLGMSRTTFRNASGLPNRGQLSTARDMMLLTRLIRDDFPEYYHYFRTKRFRFGRRVYRNHNKLLGRYVGTNGVKTGYTNASGYNLVASVSRDGRNLIGVVFGGRSGARRDRHMIRLMEKSFKKLSQLRKLPAPPLPVPRPVLNNQLVASSGEVSVRENMLNNGSDRKNELSDEFNSLTNTRRKVEPAAPLRWGIQVGAYSSNHPARAVIKTVRLHLGAALIHGRDNVERVRRSHGTIYRARIMGLLEGEARDACMILISKHLPCVPVPGDVDVAQVHRSQ